MKKMRAFLWLTLLVFGLTSNAIETKDLLNNQGVIELKRLGLDETAIIERIKASKCSFDTSIDELQKLKEAGLSEAVLAAMISSTATKSDVPSAGDSNDPSAPHDPGIWLYEEENGRTRMTKIGPTPFSETKIGVPVLLGRSRIRAPMSGSHANLQVVSRRPVFYFYFGKTQSGISDASQSATGPDDFALLKAEVNEKKDSRSVVIGKMDLHFGGTSGIDPKKTGGLEYVKESTGSFRVTTKKDLEDGEYCILYDGQLAPTGADLVNGGPGEGFCFGVAGKAPSQSR